MAWVDANLAYKVVMDLIERLEHRGHVIAVKFFHKR